MGFLNQQFQSNEGDGFAILEFGILNDATTQVEVPVEVFFSDSTAQSKFLQLLGHMMLC